MGVKILCRVFQIQLHILYWERNWIVGEDVVPVQSENNLEILLNGNCCVRILLRCHLRDLKVVLYFSRCHFHCHEFSRSFVETYDT